MYYMMYYICNILMIYYNYKCNMTGFGLYPQTTPVHKVFNRLTHTARAWISLPCLPPAAPVENTLKTMWTGDETSGWSDPSL